MSQHCLMCQAWTACSISGEVTPKRFKNSTCICVMLFALFADTVHSRKQRFPRICIPVVNWATPGVSACCRSAFAVCCTFALLAETVRSERNQFPRTVKPSKRTTAGHSRSWQHFYSTRQHKKGKLRVLQLNVLCVIVLKDVFCNWPSHKIELGTKISLCS